METPLFFGVIFGIAISALIMLLSRDIIVRHLMKFMHAQVNPELTNSIIEMSEVVAIYRDVLTQSKDILIFYLENIDKIDPDIEQKDKEAAKEHLDAIDPLLELIEHQASILKHMKEAQENENL